MTLSGPVMPLYVKSLGIGPVQWGALASAWALGMFLLEWVWGGLSDTRDGRPLLAISALCMSVVYFLFTVHALIPLFIVLEFVSGAVGVAVGPMTRAYVSAESPGKSIGLFASLWWSSFMLGQVIGPVVGSFVAQTWSFQSSFYASAILSIALAFFALCLFPKHKELRRKNDGTNLVSGLRSVLGLRSVRLLFLSTVLIFIGRSLVITFLPLYASSVIGMSTLQVGILVALVSALELVSMPALGWLSDRFGLKHTAVLSYGFSATLLLLYFLAKTIYQVFLISIALGIGLSGLFLLLALMRTVTPSGTYGRAMGAYGSCEDLGIMIGPIIYGFVWSAYGPVYIFFVGCLVQLFAAFLILRVKQRS